MAGQVNGYMPKHVIHKLADALNDREQSLKGSRILILGVAYKPDVSDTRESPALEIIHLLRERGAYVFYHDPHVPELRVDGILMKSIPLIGSSAIGNAASRVGGARAKAKSKEVPAPPPQLINGFRSSDARFPLSHFDCVVIVTHHSAIDYNFVVEHAALILDTRNATKHVPSGRDKIVKL